MKTFVIGDVHGRRAQLTSLIDMLPLDKDKDTLVFLGDLIDRGVDAPGVVDDVWKLKNDSFSRVIYLRGNHEQMLLDFLDQGAALWLAPATGGQSSFEQYTGTPLQVNSVADFDTAREMMRAAMPESHLELIRDTVMFHEDDFAIYVHAGLEKDKHPSDSDTAVLMWARDEEFFKHYHGKPCIFGHTPTPYLPLLGRLGRHGIYISHSAIGIDTGYNHQSPLTCLSLPDFTLYQAFVDGHTAIHHITTFIPEELRGLQKKAEAEKQMLDVS
jgi:serine/threonine protein phosphatase 1